MKVIFRADASNNVGSGHVMRCLVLAEGLLKHGHDVVFACRDLPGNLIDFITQKSVKVIPLCKPSKTVKVKHSADYEAWLQVSWAQDAREFMSAVNSADLVVVDHYALDEQWEKTVKDKLNCAILVIDDLNRTHKSEFIVDQNRWPDMATRYQTCSGIKLLGPDYALLRPSFSILRQKQLLFKNQVLAFFGGSDLTGECIKLVKAATRIKSLPFTLKVVTGRANTAYSELLMLTQGSDIIVEQFIEDFDLELKQSNYVIGASGVSNWERFCLRVPATIVAVADNQKVLSKYLASLGAVRYLGDSNVTCIDTYQSELFYLCRDWPNIDQLQPIFVDGLGVSRIIETLEKGVMK